MPSRSLARLLTLSVVAALVPVATPSASGAEPAQRRDDRIPGRYIVVFRRSVEDPGALTDRLERGNGFRARLRYRHALEGFSAALTSQQVARLREHPKVEFVTADREARASGTVELATGDRAPTGVRRFEAASTTHAHEASGVNVAVIDTGIDLGHPDLNAVHGKNCVGSGNATDDNGHGTHVAGTIAAENDGAGVVGAAPGTKVWAVKVLDARGSGSWSQIICGVDWATSTRTDADGTNDIAVSNMSLGGLGSPVKDCASTTDALHKAICNSTAAGVTYVVAAGNDGWDFDYAPQPDVPAAYPQVLTVTAVSDSDGLPGGTGGAPTCRSGELDDKHASFSNYAKTAAGKAHTIAGPGVCITSDWPGGGTKTISGTSMATPHIAGLVALCLNEAGVAGECSGLSPAQIIEKIRADAAAHNTSNTGYGFTGDPIRPVSDRYYGYLARMGLGAPGPAPEPTPDTTAPTVTSVAPSEGASGVSPSTTVAVTFSEAMDQGSAQGAFSLAPSGGGAAVFGSFSWSGSTMTFRPGAPLAEGTDYTAGVTTAAKDPAGNAVAAEKVWSFRTLTNVTASASTATIEAGSLRSGGVGQLAADDGAFYEVGSTSSGTRTTSWYGTFSGVSNSLTSLRIRYSGKSSKSCAQTVAVRRGAEWVQVDSRSVGTTEILVQATPPGSPADYVTGDTGSGDVHVRVRCTRSGSAFVASGDLLQLTGTL